jgi:hypothetical protein
MSCGSSSAVTIWSDSITFTNWANGDTGNQVHSINAGGDTLVASQVQHLVQAMASFGNNAGFNPTTATAMPTYNTLQTAVAANWHARVRLPAPTGRPLTASHLAKE